MRIKLTLIKRLINEVMGVGGYTLKYFKNNDLNKSSENF